MIPTRKTRSLSAALAVTLITLSTICFKQAISISDQQQQVASESQQKQTPLAQAAQSTGTAAMKAAVLPTSSTKSPTTAEQTGEQPGALVTSGSRNIKSQQQQASAKHSNPAGKVRKLARQQGTDARASAPSAGPTSDQRQEEAAAQSIYHNTPPSFLTPTRDFYLDVARPSVGAKLTTIQAIDMEGDQIEYSLKPANKAFDASPYFSINSTSGDLRLISKRIFEPRAVDRDDSEEELDAWGQLGEQLQQERREQADGADYSYILNVAAWDGHYTSVIELKIHVLNLPNAPIRLTPEGSHREGESLMRIKTSEFLTNLKRRPVLNNSTIVLPSFVNPPLMSDPFVTGKRRDDEITSPQSPPNKSLQREDSVHLGDLEPDQEALGLGTRSMNSQSIHGLESPQQATTIITESPAAVATSKQHAAWLVQQPMILSIVMIVFACVVIAFVLLVFIVPISVKRLKKRLKNMERQHEQLSQKASNGGSSMVGSCLSHGGSLTVNSMTTNGSSRDGCHGLPSSLSQFTLASSDRSCAIMPALDHQHRLLNGGHQAHFGRIQLNRQSSLDSAMTNQAENYSSSQFTTSNQMSTTQSYLASAQQHQRAMMAMNSASGSPGLSFDHTRRGDTQITCLTDGQRQLTNNGLNRINNGSIVNPVYLHQLSAASRVDSAVKMSQNNIYCPVDDEFYSTINTDNTLDDEIAAHNYNLYTIQRGQDAHALTRASRPTQMLTHDQVGSLVGQTSDVSNYFASGSAQPVSLTRDAASPAQSTSSRSSTRSLARFLSLPARHWSHQNDSPDATKGDDSNKRKGGLLDELQFDFDATAAGLTGNQLAKTIARADRISHEQQVRHKRNRSPLQADPACADEWEVERHKLRFLNILDEGQFGLVWRCKLKVNSAGRETGTVGRAGADELTVAVKTLKSFAAKDVREREELLAEIEIMKLVCHHPNVVRILHCCTRDIGPTRPILLVMEHVELGKLQSFLEKSRTNHQYATAASLCNNASSRRTLHSNGGGIALGQDYRMMAGSVASSTSILLDGIYEQHTGKQQSLTPAGIEGRCPDRDQHQSSGSQNQLTSRDLIKFIYHVAKGMEHISSNCIVHRDLASRNILISSQRVCKIGDFGMARHMENMGDVYERHSRNTKVPVRWMAPEVLLENSFTTKSDVFSLGILMWEIVTLGSTPYRHLKTDQIIQAVARDGERPERPEYCHELLYDIMSRCWSQNPSERPSFHELVTQLDALLMSTEEYIQLDQYPDHNYYNISQTAAPFELL